MGLAVLPYDGGTYTQAPFEDIDKHKFNDNGYVINGY